MNEKLRFQIIVHTTDGVEHDEFEEIVDASIDSLDEGIRRLKTEISVRGLVAIDLHIREFKE